MFTSLRSRLLATHLLVAGLVLFLLLVSFILILATNPAGEQLVYNRLDTLQRIGAAQVRLRSSGQDRLALQRILNVLARPVGAHVVLLDNAGNSLYESPVGAPSLPPGSVERALADERGRATFRDGRGRLWLLSAGELPAGRTMLAMAPRPTVRTLALMAREGLGPLTQAAVVSLFLSALVAILIARGLARPLTRVGTAAQAVAGGDFDQQLEPEGPDEVRELAVAFNDMVRQVRASQQAQQDFVANVSHELKTPLTSIGGFAQALVDGTAGSESEKARAGQVILQEARRLHRLVEDLLDLARFDAGQVVLDRSPVNLDELLKGLIDPLSLSARERGIELRSEIGDLPLMVADGDRLAQVFINLIDNAIKHSRQGGHVLVEGSSQRGWTEVRVADSGPGIDPGEMARLFERFYQIDRARAGGEDRGTGLGLAIAQEIVRAHGGSITVDSTPGAGSVFTVRLPVSRPEDSTIQRIRR